MINLRISPKQELSWKRRPGRGPAAKQALDKAVLKFEKEGAPNYLFQAERLVRSFENLVTEKRSYPDRKYIQFVLLPEEGDIEEPLKEYFSDEYFLDLVSIEPFGLHSLAFFEPSNWEKCLKNLGREMRIFKKYADKEISEIDFQNRRITLIHDFALHTSERISIPDYVERPIEKLSLGITAVKRDSDLKQFIYSCADQAGLSIRVSEHGVIRETDILGQLNGGVIESKSFSLFLKALTVSPEIKMIYLDKAAIIDSNGFTSQIRQSLPFIENPPQKCPIICVIDTGVQSNHYTEKVFVEEENGSGICLDKDGNPQYDPVGHGTMVACKILYGPTLETNVIPERRTLLPVAKVFPVKLQHEGEDGVDFPYRQLFSVSGDLAQAVKRLNIRLINLSINRPFSDRLHFPDRVMSEEAAIIDLFSRTLGVIVIVSSGNIKREALREFLESEGKEGLEMLDHVSDAAGKHLRVLPPADFLSGISVGSCYESAVGKFFPSWFSRCLPGSCGKSPIKPDCLAIGGDYLLKIDNGFPSVESTHARSVLLVRSFGHMNSDDYLFLDVGTSFSAPQVTRVLAIAIANFPEASIESIKGLFMHRAVSYKAVLKKRTDDEPPTTINLLEAFRGSGLLSELDEMKFLMGQGNGSKGDERTYAVEGEIGHERIMSYDIPLDQVQEMMRGLEDHRIGVRVSVSYFPLLPKGYQFDQPILFKEANQLHIAACLHSPEIEPVIEGKRAYHPIPMVAEGWIKHGLVPWTMHYYNTIQTPFSNRNQSYAWDDFKKRVGRHDSIRLSVRCHINDTATQGEKQRFSVIITFEDLGAFGKARSKARGELTANV